MEFKKVVEDSVGKMLRTEKSLMGPVNPRIFHAVLGVADEAGEMIGHMKKVIYYNVPLDLVNLMEEAGDMWWFYRLLLDEMARIQGISVSDCFLKVLAINEAKLQRRYPDGYSDEKAVNRDTAAEREEMEKQLDKK